eukprot:3725680-Alexandrium_andersonii.AAC.1
MRMIAWEARAHWSHNPLTQDCTHGTHSMMWQDPWQHHAMCLNLLDCARLRRNRRASLGLSLEHSVCAVLRGSPDSLVKGEASSSSSPA